jgi:hypothetical protein
MLGKLPEQLHTPAAHSGMKRECIRNQQRPLSQGVPKVLQISRCEACCCCCCNLLSDLGSNAVLSALICSRSRVAT